MMTCLSKHQAVVDLLADDELRELAVRICHRYADDLIQEVAMVILEMDEDKWTNVNDGGYLRTT